MAGGTMAARLILLSVFFSIFWFSRTRLPLNYQHGTADIQVSSSQLSGKFFLAGLSEISPQLFRPCQSKRVKIQSKFNITFPVQKASKRGQTTLALPEKLFVLDLTVFLDVHKNPGPEMQTASFRSSLAPVNLNLHANNGVIKYSKNQFQHIEHFRGRMADNFLNALSIQDDFNIPGYLSDSGRIPSIYSMERQNKHRPRSGSANLNNLVNIILVKLRVRICFTSLCSTSVLLRRTLRSWKIMW